MRTRKAAHVPDSRHARSRRTIIVRVPVLLVYDSCTASTLLYTLTYICGCLKPRGLRRIQVPGLRSRRMIFDSLLAVSKKPTDRQIDRSRTGERSGITNVRRQTQKNRHRGGARDAETERQPRRSSTKPAWPPRGGGTTGGGGGRRVVATFTTACGVAGCGGRAARPIGKVRRGGHAEVALRTVSS